ncbi:MAG: NAD+ synthase [Proteobacteria bacterium]|nr:NAD+ synthase [Pseudomonadota bacterium]
MTDRLKILIAQQNPTVGDVAGNADLLRRARAEGAALGADLVVSSELVITGYPPEDLILRPAFLESVEAEIKALARDTADGGPALVLGAPWREDGKIYNAAVLLDGGEVAAVRYKHDLPNYGVFDEKRLFVAGPLPGPVDFRGVRLGLMICEDMWTPEVCECLQETGAEILIAINGSPFEADKHDARINFAVARANECKLPIAYVNQVGGQDELVFDGGSFVVNADYALAAQLPLWRSVNVLTEWSRDGDGGWACAQGALDAAPAPLESIYLAMMTGLRDYVGKNGFPGIILGLSGGIDSALTAAVAVDALGAGRVHCVLMPSRYTSQGSLDDAAALAAGLGVRFDTISIEPAVGAFDGMLAGVFAGRAPDTTEENIQARARAVILMAISNKFGCMLLTTGNKSEMSVGYATLYGDLSGGYSVLKDVYKTTVYELSDWRNQHTPEGAQGPGGEVIPASIITKAPSAELRADQTDQDTLPPYDELDDILRCLIEEERPFAEIAARGHAEETVRRIARMVYIAEYKRRQAPPGVKITSRSFGRDRRYPMTNAFTETLK